MYLYYHLDYLGKQIQRQVGYEKINKTEDEFDSYLTRREKASLTRIDIHIFDVGKFKMQQYFLK